MCRVLFLFSLYTSLSSAQSLSTCHFVVSYASTCTLRMLQCQHSPFFFIFCSVIVGERFFLFLFSGCWRSLFFYSILFFFFFWLKCLIISGICGDVTMLVLPCPSGDGCCEMFRRLLLPWKKKKKANKRLWKKNQKRSKQIWSKDCDLTLPHRFYVTVR